MFDQNTPKEESQVKALQVLTEVQVLQKRKSDDISKDDSTTEIGSLNKRGRPSETPDNGTGLTSSEKPVKSLTDETQKSRTLPLDKGKGI